MNDNQRRIVEEYLNDPPERTPLSVRQIRWNLHRKQENGRAFIDLDQIQRDLELLKVLKDFEIPVGRVKKKGWAEQKARFVVRQLSSKALKAEVILEKE